MQDSACITIITLCSPTSPTLNLSFAYQHWTCPLLINTELVLCSLKVNTSRFGLCHLSLHMSSKSAHVINHQLNLLQVIIKMIMVFNNIHVDCWSSSAFSFYAHSLELSWLIIILIFSFMSRTFIPRASHIVYHDSLATCAHIIKVFSCKVCSYP